MVTFSVQTAHQNGQNNFSHWYVLKQWPVVDILNVKFFL